MEWTIEPLAAVAASHGYSLPVGAGIAGGATAPASDVFAGLMNNAVHELNASVGAAERAMTDLSAGKPVELHEVMISLERARISVQTFIQVRNKLVESYQDLTRMQL